MLVVLKKAKPVIHPIDLVVSSVSGKSQKNPLQIVEVSGFDPVLQGEASNLSFGIWNPSVAPKNLIEDVSSISFRECTRVTTILCHESKSIDGSMAATYLP
ncbi:MAG: hypothetical protein R6W06_05160 [Prochlorococcaceae cyanobacterium]